MNELLQITTDKQGSSVVSARELYESLGFELSQWSRWHKKNILTNAFAIQGTDWEQLDIVSKTSEGGRPSTDYALTLDFAERLCMLARTDKGEEVRRWFQAIKNKALHQATDPALRQILQQQTQLLSSQQRQLDQLRAEVAQLQPPTRSARGRSLPVVPPHMRPSSETDLRRLINRGVNDYCARYGVEHRETYHYLYQRLQDVFGIDAYRLERHPNETMLEAVERYGHLRWLYALVRSELPTID